MVENHPLQAISTMRATAFQTKPSAADNAAARPSAADTPASDMSTAKPSIKKLSVLLPASLHLRAKRQALLTDQSLTELITTLLANHLDSADRKPND